MKKLLLIFFTLLFSTALMAANTLKEFVILGDSLSDNGNLYKVLKVVPKSPPYYQGRFSNGPTWADHVGNYFYKKYYMDYSNYAYGGATTVLHHLRTDKFIAPMLLQVELDSYFLHSPLKDKDQAIFALWIGANDYLYEKAPDIDDLTSKVVNKITETATTLLEKGAHGVIVMNLPDLASTPYARNHQNQERLAAISKMHNDKLTNAMNILSAKYKDKVLYYDIYALFTDLLIDPDKYNKRYGTDVTDTRESCWLGTVLGVDNNKFAEDLKISGVESESVKPILQSPILNQTYQIGLAYDNGKKPCDNADQHLFWDDLHPTAVIHQVLGKILIEFIEQSNWLNS